MRSVADSETSARVRGGLYRRAEWVIAWALPSIGDVIFVAVLLGATFALQGLALGMDGDAGWNLRIGLQILRHGLPRNEFLLSTTYGQPVVYWEWLSQVCYALAYQLGGLNGVVALAGLLVAVTSLGLYAALRVRRVPLLLALALAVAGIGLTSITWTARAQLFSLALTMWTSEEIWRYWRDGRAARLWRFPPVFALWANLHGGFLGGLLLLATALVVTWLFPAARGRAEPRRLAWSVAASVAATLVNPWGVGLWGHILGYLRNPLIARYTQEYQSPDFHSLAGLLFLGLTITLVACWMFNARRAGGAGLHPLAAANALLWTALGCVSVRFVPLWALVVLPLLGQALTSALRDGVVASTEPGNAGVMGALVSRGRAVVLWAGGFSRRLAATDARVGRGVWGGLAIVAVLVVVLHQGALPGSNASVLSAQFDAKAFPVAAARRLEAGGLPEGTGFTTYEWGGYLDFALPAFDPFIDSRSDAYPQQLLADYARIEGVEPGWRVLLDRYGVRWALLPAGGPLAELLALSPGWTCAAEDSVGVAVLCTRGG